MSEQEIYIEAMNRRDHADRRRFLDEACAGNEVLRERIETLIRQSDQLGSFLEKSPQPLGATADISGAEESGTQIGPYKLIEQIGEGGMGTVWMAQQSEPVKRLVALKLIKAGMDSRQVIARFEAERQALALMDHPNIARVLDGGTTEAGRPYFVMDLVRGVPITRYCDEHHLTPRQRLELFIPVCQAIQHAHQKGIIHRDLKPSNVLVARDDGNPAPKVIDFGVAKAIGQSLTDKTLVTGFGNIVGTLEYMSPEQAEVNQLDIDTRSDIYSLGVLLYELLTGSPPFSRKELEKGGMLEMLRVIREEEPSKPSTKLSTAEGLPTLAANRGTEPAKLTKLMHGELDWIVMKALEKDRSRRYETASGLAHDIEHYLHDEPVGACPPSMAYRLRKFTRRNKAALVMAATVALAALVAVGSIGWIIRDQSARQATLNHGVELAIHEASTARDQALNLTDNRHEWQALLAAASAALQRAEELADQDLAALDPAVRARLQSLRVQLKSDASDRAFVAAFDDILAQVIVWDARRSQFSSEAPFHAIEDAFESCYGLQFEATPVAELVSFLKDRPKPIQAHLLAALDVSLARVALDDPQTKQWLADVLQAADDDAWRKQAREALERNDWAACERLLQNVTVMQQPPAILLLLSSYLPSEAWSAKHDLVLQVQASYPGDPAASRFGHASACDLLAWVLATGSDPSNGNEKRAVELARRAVRLVPRDGDFWNTLGVANYRAGNWQEAVAALDTATQLSQGGDAVDWLFLAMAHWRLGHKDEAHQWYDRAVRTPKTSKLLESQLPRFRAEASNLLGIEK